MDSILTSIKKLLGIDEDYEHFDADIIMHINTSLFRLRTIGVGPLVDGIEGNDDFDPKPFNITDKTQVWSELVGTRNDLESIKTYIYLKVKLVFDPPQTSFVIESYNKQLAELEWLINEQSGGDLDDA